MAKKKFGSNVLKYIWEKMKKAKKKERSGGKRKRREMEGRKEEGKDGNFHWMLKAN